MRVLLTGRAGFVGSAIADALAARGDEVVGLDLLLPAAHGTAAPELPDLVVGDVRDAAIVGPLLRGVDVVCHQASMVGLGVAVSDLPEYVSHNVFGTSVLLAEMAAAGVTRLVQASSMVIYGEGRYTCADHGNVRPAPRSPAALAAGLFEPPCPHCGCPLDWSPVPESATPDPRNAYATTKLAQEHLAAGWTTSTDGHAISLRYHNIYGPGMPRDTPYAGVAAIFRSALESGRAPRVLEDGRQMRDFVHVHDVAAANLLAIDRIVASDPRTVSAYNVCSGEPRSVGAFARELSTAFGGPDPEVVGGGRPGDVRHVVADPTSARLELGFVARVPFSDGVRRFATDPLRAAATPTGPQITSR
ncbi:MAG: NAD-dependent epimerase/dehydratase family protein [Nakamurella sp.]